MVKTKVSKKKGPTTDFDSDESYRGALMRRFTQDPSKALRRAQPKEM